ncbi:AbiH family protein [Arcticibacterium luteifluviistationis]|uniref:Bacteriophage abortive infection AbiH n=1 Tax=Arcticibacterium luteifluviistationis TaxID=1784714 RepID=A0A2Z4GEV6_9BACT|nr:AbiH family protein [Arcticibacterium luteifluviistationis]AWV99565.1 hypothetical protein DJ013_15870 [Arcticibacterium luteifluviistationis]
MGRFKKENTLVIVGNGFDLAHGYKTRYSDFVEDIFFGAIKKQVPELNSDARAIGVKNELITIPDKYYKFDNEKSIADQVLENGSHKIEFNNRFFGRIISGNLYKWVDYESFYFNELLKTVEGNVSITELNAEFKTVKKFIVDYLERELMGTFHEPDRVPISDSINDFFQQLNVSYEYERMESGADPIHILNFNYSNTPKRYSNTEGFFLNNIHGTLLDKSQIIFGYGDETVPSYQKIEDLNVDDYHKFFKSIGYLMDDKYSKLLDFIDREEGFDVEILGHSCGISDRVLLKTIFEHSNCKKIRIHYHEWENKLGVLENDFESKMINISRHFSDKKVLRSKVLNFKESKPLIPFRLQNKFR